MNDLHNDGARPRAHTYPVPRARILDDSARNQLAELAGEADEPCYFCGEPVRPSLRGGLHNIVEYWEFTADDDGELPCHEECYDDAIGWGR